MLKTKFNNQGSCERLRISSRKYTLVKDLNNYFKFVYRLSRFPVKILFKFRFIISLLVLLMLKEHGNVVSFNFTVALILLCIICIASTFLVSSAKRRKIEFYFYPPF